MRALLALILLLFSVSAHAVDTQTLVPMTTINSVWLHPTLPLSSGSDCIYVLDTTENPPDRKLCSNYATAMGGILAPANTIVMNPYAGPALEVLSPMPPCPDTTGQQLNFVSGTGIICPAGILPNAITFGSFSLPTGTSSASFVMAGIASNGGFSPLITPDATGKVYVSLVGGQLNGASAPQTISYQIRYGTGTPPANGDPATGTALGSVKTITVSPSPIRSSIRAIGYVTGLTLGTQYWFDVAISAPSGGFAQIYAGNMFVAER